MTDKIDILFLLLFIYILDFSYYFSWFYALLIVLPNHLQEILRLQLFYWSNKLRPFCLSCLSIVLVEVGAGGHSVLKQPKSSHECGGEDDNTSNKRNCKGKSWMWEEVPMKARLKSQKILMTYIIIVWWIKNCSIII